MIKPSLFIQNTPSHKLLISGIENEVKLIIFTRDFTSHSYQRLSCTKKAPCLTLNNFLIWYAIEMAAHRINLLQIGYQAPDFSITLEEMTDEKLSTLQNVDLVNSKKTRPFPLSTG